MSAARNVGNRPKAEHPAVFPVESRAAIPGLHSEKDR
jgi:hypothetical protein